MSKTHAKKRNVGLLYEWLTLAVSQSLVSGDKQRSSRALRIVKRHFKPGTELYKEFRLVNSLAKTSVSNATVAANILQEARLAAKTHDVSVLDKQKTSLIHDINHNLGGEDFYDQHVNNYKTLATIQTLVNEWRQPAGAADLKTLAEYEDSLVKWLTEEKNVVDSSVMHDQSPGTARLLMKVMMKKLNEKYAGVLSAEQRQLIKAYAFSEASPNDRQLTISKKLAELRDLTVNSIDEYVNSDPTVNEFVKKKLTEARSQIIAENISSVDDALVTRFMLYVKLLEEIKSEEGKEDV